jgi:hypothetical protein
MPTAAPDTSTPQAASTPDTTPSTSPDSTGTPASGGGNEAGGGLGGNGTGTGTGQGTGAGPFGIDTGGGGDPRHIVYVVDISGSMTTRAELTSALSTLTPAESFDLISFAADVHPFDEALERATSDNLAVAKQWLEYQRPDGGTNLQDALTRALRMPGVNVVVLITDGVPTVGETDFGKIARNIRKRNVNHARIYTIGLIGRNPDGTSDAFEAQQLLTHLADDSGGTHKFVILGDTTPD